MQECIVFGFLLPIQLFALSVWGLWIFVISLITQVYTFWDEIVQMDDRSSRALLGCIFFFVCVCVCCVFVFGLVYLYLTEITIFKLATLLQLRRDPLGSYHYF